MLKKPKLVRFLAACMTLYLVEAMSGQGGEGCLQRERCDPYLHLGYNSIGSMQGVLILPRNGQFYLPNLPPRSHAVDVVAAAAAALSPLLHTFTDHLPSSLPCCCFSTQAITVGFLSWKFARSGRPDKATSRRLIPVSETLFTHPRCQ